MAGFSGTVGIGWGDVSPTWMRYRLNDGRRSADTTLKSSKTVGEGIGRVARDNVRHCYSGVGMCIDRLHTYEICNTQILFRITQVAVSSDLPRAILARLLPTIQRVPRLLKAPTIQKALILQRVQRLARLSKVQRQGQQREQEEQRQGEEQGQ